MIEMLTAMMGGKAKGNTKFQEILKLDGESTKMADRERLQKFREVKTGQYTDPDPYGDGDQTMTKGYLESEVLRKQWVTGMNYNPENDPISDFVKICWTGNAGKLEKILNENRSSSDKLRKLLEHRVSLMHISSIFHVIIGARTRGELGRKDEYIRCLKLLIQAGVRTNAKDFAGHTPLHHCCSTYWNDITYEMALILLESGVDPNARNRFGQTPMFTAVVSNGMDLVEALLKKGADPSIKDCSGSSCLDNPSPKMATLMSQYIVINDRKKKPEKSTDTTCAVCNDKSKGTTRCTGCFSIFYCSTECQKQDWKQHKASCKSIQTNFIPVTLIDPPNTQLYNTSSKGINSKKKGAGIPANTLFTVKVQVPLMGASEQKNADLLIYNKERSCMGFLKPTEAAHAPLLKAVVDSNGVKGFFHATCKNDIVKINPHDFRPMELW
eukprot:TRINITY_DN725_c3_g1_i1.p1 TRINITY_DN725_c3_g1~~TRINITY_DN725_c3_g1_i1.p1  ORF type:complete len:483 (+),score=50.33 TRINITY_DN725_c3_g1_i1:130-1449(+)